MYIGTIQQCGHQYSACHAITTGDHFGQYLGMPGFVTDIFRIACFDLRNGKQFMRTGQCPYTKCIG